MIQMPNAYLPAVQFEAIVIVTIWKFASIWEVSTSVKHIDCILTRSIYIFFILFQAILFINNKHVLRKYFSKIRDLDHA